MAKFATQTFREGNEIFKLNPNTGVSTRLAGDDLASTLQTAGNDLSRIAEGRPDFGVKNNPVISSTGQRGVINALGEEITNRENASNTDSLKAASQAEQDRIKTEREMLEQRREETIQLIEQQAEQAKQIKTGVQEREFGGRSTGLITSGGGFLGTTQSQEGVLQTLRQDHRVEMDALDAKKNAALQAARNAFEDKDFALAESLSKEIKDTEQEIFEREQSFNQNLLDEAKKEKNNKDKFRVDTFVSDAIDQGFSSVEDIFDIEGNTFTADQIKASIANFAEQTGSVNAAAFTGDVKNFVSLKQNFPHILPSSISSLPENEQLEAYVKWIEGGGGSGVISSVGGFTGQGIVSGMSSYDSNILTARIGKQIFGTRISDKEGDRVESFIRDGMAQGKSEFEIMDDVLGFKIKRNKPLAENLRNTLLSVADEDGLSGFDMLGLARMINDGNDRLAVQRVENIVYDIARKSDPDFFIGDSQVKFMSEKTNEVRDAISEAGEESPVGFVKGSMQKWLKRLKGKEGAKIEASVTNLVAEMRNRLSGTAVTETEQKFLDPLIPSLNDTPANFMIKLNQLESDPLLRLNSIRATYNLPELTTESLATTEDRLPLYSESSESVSKEQKATQDTIVEYIDSNPESIEVVTQNKDILAEMLGREPTTDEYLQAYPNVIN